MEKHILQELLENGNFECRSYSGRGMYGKECLGVVCKNERQVISKIIEALANESINDHFDVSDAFSEFYKDNLGSNTIVYFPGIKFVDE